MPGREEAFARAREAQVRTLQELQDRFTQTYFPGGDALPQDVVRLHDAAHQWANISPSRRGEAQQAIVDMAGGLKLAQETGARGFVNTAPFPIVDSKSYGQLDWDAYQRAVQGESRLRSQFVDSGQGRADGVGLNSPRAFQSPPITSKEFRNLRRRGEEFYGQLSEQILDGAGLSGSEVAERFPFQAGPALDVVEMPANAGGKFVHESPGLKVSGGYDVPGKLSYGPARQHMNPVLHLTMQEGDYSRMAGRRIAEEVKGALASGSVEAPKPQPGILGQLKTAMGLGESNLDDVSKVYNRFNRAYGLPAATEDISAEALIKNLKSIRGGSELSAAFGTSPGWDSGNRVIGPMNLPLRNSEAPPTLRSGPTVTGATEAIVDARQLGKIRNAIRTGANVTTDIAGSVPLFDPEFRQAVEQGRPGAAAGMVARDYAIGTAAAPVVGAGAGVLQRAAPKAAARVLPAVAGATRVGNPVAVVSQIGGDSRQSQAQVVAAQQAAERQLNRARAARQRGGKWGIGPLRLPELGISEAGGLLFGGNKSGRQIGTRAVLGGKPVVWTGDNYGWQSPASAAKVGVR